MEETTGNVDKYFINVELLITETEKRPPLYDLTLKVYSDRDVKQKLWFYPF